MNDSSASSASTQPQAINFSSSDYDRALQFWYGRTNFEYKSPLPNELKLERMRALLDRLGNPERRVRIIHVAGSKGKGSTSAMLDSILHHAGYRVGLFTSPHLSAVEERIQVDRRPISADELTSLLSEIASVLGPTGEVGNWGVPTFFEIATAVGFLHFVRRRCELAVIEVGLGGRFDSTNVCRPILSVITSISFDHTQQLGTTLSSIAREKAGIVKENVPVVSGVIAGEPRMVIEEVCQNRQARLTQLGIDFNCSYEPGMVHGTLPAHQGSTTLGRVMVKTRSRTWPAQTLGLLGGHQAANAAVGVACVEELRQSGLIIPDVAVSSGLASVDWPARMEVLGTRPIVLLDCAHNVASAEVLAETLEASFPPCRKCLIFASSNDKDVTGMFRVLAPHFFHVILTRYGNNPRSVAPEELADILSQTANVPASVCASAALAWQEAKKIAAANDLICIAGSVFLAGELRPILLQDQVAMT